MLGFEKRQQRAAARVCDPHPAGWGPVGLRAILWERKKRLYRPTPGVTSTGCGKSAGAWAIGAPNA